MTESSEQKALRIARDHTASRTQSRLSDYQFLYTGPRRAEPQHHVVHCSHVAELAAMTGKLGGAGARSFVLWIDLDNEKVVNELKSQ